MTNKLLTIIVALLFLTGCQESMDERCAREAKQYTEKKCPALISPGVTIDSMVYYADSRTLTYYYTVEGRADNPDIISQQRDELRNDMLRELRNSTGLKDYKEAGYNFSYVYHSAKNSGTQLFEVTFREKDYR